MPRALKQILRQKRTAALIGSLMSGLVLGCGPGSDFLRRQEAMSLNLQRQLADQKLRVTLLEARVENEERSRWSQQLCKSGKIAEFVSELQAGIPETCTAGSLESALIFLNTQVNISAYLRPDQGIDDLHPARLGQVRDLLDPYKLFPSTSVIVLVQPDAEQEGALRRALQLGEAFNLLLRREYSSSDRERRQPKRDALRRDLRILGPYLLPCRLRGEVSRRYSSPMDKPLLGEPSEGTPRARIWAFRTDC